MYKRQVVTPVIEINEKVKAVAPTKKAFFNDTATTEIYTYAIVGNDKILIGFSIQLEDVF
ncbi:hypothetical protein JMUB7517_27780 [Staphylococcus aureus]